MPEYADILQNRKKHLEHIRMLEAEHDRKIESMERKYVNKMMEQDQNFKKEIYKKNQYINLLESMLQVYQQQNESKKSQIANSQGSYQTSRIYSKISDKQNAQNLIDCCNSDSLKGTHRIQISSMLSSVNQSSRHSLQPVNRPQNLSKIKIKGGMR